MAFPTTLLFLALSRIPIGELYIYGDFDRWCFVIREVEVRTKDKERYLLCDSSKKNMICCYYFPRDFQAQSKYCKDISFWCFTVCWSTQGVGQFQCFLQSWLCDWSIDWRPLGHGVKWVLQGDCLNWMYFCDQFFLRVVLYGICGTSQRTLFHATRTSTNWWWEWKEH